MMHLKFLRSLPLVVLPLFILAFTCLTTLSAQEVAFGGIELAASSIKGITFVFQPGAETTVGKRAVQQPERMKRLQYAERNANFVSMRDGCKLTDKGLDLLVQDTSEVIKELRDGAESKNLGTLQLFLVASSGLGAICNKSEILARVQAETGLCMDFISAADEARYSLGFVLPRDRYRSLILDIGGGNTKGGYYVVTKGADWPPKEWHGLEIEYGARTLKDEAVKLMNTAPVDADGKPLDYYQAIDAVLQTKVLPRIETLKLENSALANFSQVYLVGGSVWAASTRARPVQQEQYAISSLKISDFDQVLADVKDGTYSQFNGSEFGPKVSHKTREDAENELQDVLQRFDAESLYAGVSLVRFIIQQTMPSARLYFPTTAAWISGYARERFKETGSSVNVCKIPTNQLAGK
jgi:hypothetical protein